MVELGIVERFRRRVPDDVLTALVASIRQGTRDAGSRLCEALELGRYTRPEAWDVFPHERRAHVETRLQGLTEDFVGIRVESQFNKVGNCHKVIRSGGVLLTVSAVPTPNRMVRSAKHRKLYASGAAGNVDFRQSFFVVDDHNRLVIGLHDPAVLEEGLIYGVVYYSPAEDNPLGVGYVGVGFPDARYRRYVETLNLTKLFPGAVASTAVEHVEDLANVEMLLGEPYVEGVSSLFLDGGN
jgi:hypothetical protein